MYYLVSILLGMIPEVLYFTLFLIYTKDLKDKKFRLFGLISIAYIINIILCDYNVIYNVIFIFLVYLILKLLYKKKTQIIDVFIIIYGSCYLTILSFLVCFAYDIKTYWICYVIDKILLFSIFIFKKQFNKLYKKYCKYWNRNDKVKKPIKSITLRNISLILMNSIIFIMNIICIYTLNNIMK